jgi:hypothetical protein
VLRASCSFFWPFFCTDLQSANASPVFSTFWRMNQLNDQSVLKKTLDVLDEIRDNVRGEIGDVKFGEEVLKHLPQIVVTGAQSAGKSSVLTQLSGVQLPQKAERCTRVATNLKLRREPIESLSIALKRPNQGETVVAKDVCNTAAAIDELQTIAIEESDGKEFADGFVIEVAVTGPRMPNTTLVDLPGFTTSSPEDAQMVKDIVLPYLKMDNTVILHVCKGTTACWGTM